MRVHSDAAGDVVITIELDGAQYLRDVVEDEFKRTGDLGSKEIRDLVDVVILELEKEQRFLDDL